VNSEQIAMPQTLPTPTAPVQQSPIALEQPIPIERVTGVHVLVADADDNTRAVRERQLLAAGHRVSLARTAFEAIVKATYHVPDMILLDASLPDIATSETVAFLGSCPVTAHIPVARLARGRAVSQRLLGELRRRSR
jgi:CheY-like chemotaxis protein